MKLKEQKIKLPVKNFSFDRVGTETPKHSALLPNHLRALLVGPSNCGKTSLLLSLLIDKNGVKFKNIFLFSKSSNQLKYQFLKKVIDRVHDVSFYHFEDKILDPQCIPNYSVCIFDDVINLPQASIQEIFSMGRHFKIDCFYLAQTYSKIKKQLIRDNANLICLFKMDDMNLKHAFNDHASADLTYSSFKNMCKECWSEPYGFLTINKDCEVNCGKYRKALDSFISLH